MQTPALNMKQSVRLFAHVRSVSRSCEHSHDLPVHKISVPVCKRPGRSSLWSAPSLPLLSTGTWCAARGLKPPVSRRTAYPDSLVPLGLYKCTHTCL